ncbi:phage antirepressor Ant [Yersinia rohdei]|nr:phage antirepressor Ant [Yersinia rohdei]
MSSIAIAASTINVPFHGANLYVVNHNGEPYAPMKPIIDGMGMDWASQFTKLKNRFKTCVVKITMQLPGDDQQRDVTCLALRKLNGWLQTISPNKVKPEIRDKVIQYQEECDDVLYEYWTKGLVVNPRKATKKALPGKITLEQQEAVKQLVMNRGKALPKENQAKAMITMWSALKTHFGCSYKEINEDQFTDALSLAARVPIEGEFLGKQEALPTMVKQSQFTDVELCALSWLWLVADKMRRHAEETYPALKQLESKYAGDACDIAREFTYWLGNTESILSRETRHIAKPPGREGCYSSLAYLRENHWNPIPH